MLGRRMLGRRMLTPILDAKRLRKLVDQLVSINTTARFDFRFRFLIFCVTVFQFQLTGKFCESGRLRIFSRARRDERRRRRHRTLR